MNEKQRYVLIKKYYYDFTDKEIAIELAISRQAISKIHKKAIENLKKYLN
ncbi:sigma factor-like helix-turn-helix DNA-binding protein [Clostridium sulfidigenes]